MLTHQCVLIIDSLSNEMKVFYLKNVRIDIGKAIPEIQMYQVFCILAL